MPEQMLPFVDTWRSSRASELKLLDDLRGIPVHQRPEFVMTNLGKMSVFSVNHTFTPGIVMLLGRPDPQQPLADDVVDAACKLLCDRPLVFEDDRLNDVLTSIGTNHRIGKVTANVLGGLLYMASILCGMNVATRIVTRVELNKLSDPATKTATTKAPQTANRALELPQPYATIMSLKAHLESCRGEHRSGVQLEGSLADVMLPLRILLLLHRFSVNANPDAHAEDATIGPVPLTMEMWDYAIRQHLLRDLQTLWVYRLGDFIRRFSAKDGPPNADAVRRLLRALASGFAHAVPRLSNAPAPYLRCVGDWQTVYAGWDGHAVYVNFVRLPDKRVLIEVHDLWQPGQDAMTFPRADLQHEENKNRWLPYPVALVLDAGHAVWLGNLEAEVRGGACFQYVYRILEGVHARAQWKKEPAKKTVYGVSPKVEGDTIKSGDSCRKELVEAVREFGKYFLDQGSVSNCVVHNHSAARSHCEISANDHILDAELEAVGHLFPHNIIGKDLAIREFSNAAAVTDNPVPEWHIGDPGAKLARGGPPDTDHSGAASMPAAARPSSKAAGMDRTGFAAAGGASSHHDERTCIIAKFALMDLEQHVGTRNDVTFIAKALSLICSALETDAASARAFDAFFSRCAVIAASICSAMDNPVDSPGGANLLSEWLRDIAEHLTEWLKGVGFRAAEVVLAAPAALRVSEAFVTNFAEFCEDLGQFTGRHAAAALQFLVHGAMASAPGRRLLGVAESMARVPVFQHAAVHAAHAAGALLEKAITPMLLSDASASLGAATARRPASFAEALLSGVHAGVKGAATSLRAPHGASVSHYTSEWLRVRCRGVPGTCHPLLVAAVGIFLDIIPTVSKSVATVCCGASSCASGDLVLYFSNEADLTSAIQTLQSEHKGGSVHTILGRLAEAVLGDETAAFTTISFEVEHAARLPTDVERIPMGPRVEQWVALIRATVMADAAELRDAVFLWLNEVSSAPRTSTSSPLLERFTRYVALAGTAVGRQRGCDAGVPATTTTMPVLRTPALGSSLAAQHTKLLRKDVAASVVAEVHAAERMRLPGALAPGVPGARPLPELLPHWQPAISWSALDALASLTLDPRYEMSPPASLSSKSFGGPSFVTSSSCARTDAQRSSTRRWVDVASGMSDSATAGAVYCSPRSVSSVSKQVRTGALSRERAGGAGVGARLQQESNKPSTTSGRHASAALPARTTMSRDADTRPILHDGVLTRESLPLSVASASHAASATTSSRRPGHAAAIPFPSAGRSPSIASAAGRASAPLAMRSRDSRTAALLMNAIPARPGPPDSEAVPVVRVSPAAVSTDNGAAAASRRRRGAGRTAGPLARPGRA